MFISLERATQIQLLAACTNAALNPLKTDIEHLVKFLKGFGYDRLDIQLGKTIIPIKPCFADPDLALAYVKEITGGLTSDSIYYAHNAVEFIFPLSIDYKAMTENICRYFGQPVIKQESYAEWRISEQRDVYTFVLDDSISINLRQY